MTCASCTHSHRLPDHYTPVRGLKPEKLVCLLELRGCPSAGPRCPQFERYAGAEND